jgi:peptidylprolyl isomerase
MSKKKSKSNPTRFQKYTISISNIRQKYPKWKLFACGIILIIGIIIGLAVGLQPSNTATTAQNGDTVKVEYTGTLDDGTEFDSSVNESFGHHDPLQFTIGDSSTIPGFERGVIGMSVNETKKIRVKPEDGYGPAEFIEDIALFPSDVAVGQYYSGTLTSGLHIENARVTAVNESTVTLQNLHQMADLYLNFEITLVELIKAGQTSTNTSS